MAVKHKISNINLKFITLNLIKSKLLNTIIIFYLKLTKLKKNIFKLPIIVSLFYKYRKK